MRIFCYLSFQASFFSLPTDSVFYAFLIIQPIAAVTCKCKSKMYISQLILKCLVYFFELINLFDRIL